MPLLPSHYLPVSRSLRAVIVKASSGPRHVVGCRRQVDKRKLTTGTRVALDMTTFTIMRVLPREVGIVWPDTGAALPLCCCASTRSSSLVITQLRVTPRSVTSLVPPPPSLKTTHTALMDMTQPLTHSPDGYETCSHTALIDMRHAHTRP